MIPGMVIIYLVGGNKQRNATSKGRKAMNANKTTVTTVKFENFGTTCSGRVVTGWGEYAVAYSRNPYGGHNLILLVEDEANSMEGFRAFKAFRHGTPAVLAFLFQWAPQKRAMRVLSWLNGRIADPIRVGW